MDIDARDWRSELIYFLLPDRFSDGRWKDRPLVPPDEVLLADPRNRVPQKFASRLKKGLWYWNHWAVSGRNRFQGGTIRGILDDLDYLQDLGITALWLGPVWKQRRVGVDVNANTDGTAAKNFTDTTDDPYYRVNAADLADPHDDPDWFRAAQLPRDDYHGYAIQDFDGVDPRFGTEADLVELVAEAHRRGMRVIFDILINHSGENFAYGVPGTLSPIRPPFRLPDYRNLGDRYPFGAWLDAGNRPLAPGAPVGPDDAVWPEVLRDPELYSRQGAGDYGLGDDDKPDPEFRVGDYRNRDFAFPDREQPSATYDALLGIWQDWIARTGCDGFRVDTFKHVPRWVSKKFVEDIRAFAKAECGKPDFLVMGEVGGGDWMQAGYLGEIPDLRVLELAERRNDLRELAGGDVGRAPAVLTPAPTVGDRPVDATRLVMTVDDHDGLSIPNKVRIAAGKGVDAVLPAAAFLLFGPSIPCLYYGTEQALRGPVGSPDDIGNLFDYGYHLARPDDPTDVSRRGGDRYLREAMFGPKHPRRAGPASGRDRDMPGFGPRGTAGFHAFDTESVWYLGIAKLAGLRRDHPALAVGTITILDVASVDGSRYAPWPRPWHVVTWIRRHPDGSWGLVVVDLTPTGGPGFDVDLVLPGWASRYVEATRIPRNGKPADAGAPTDVARLPQTGTPHLPLGRVEPGEIRVYVSAP